MVKNIEFIACHFRTKDAQWFEELELLSENKKSNELYGFPSFLEFQIPTPLITSESLRLVGRIDLQQMW